MEILEESPERCETRRPPGPLPSIERWPHVSVDLVVMLASREDGRGREEEEDWAGGGGGPRGARARGGGVSVSPAPASPVEDFCSW